jgi:hypothetical protein
MAGPRNATEAGDGALPLSWVRDHPSGVSAGRKRCLTGSTPVAGILARREGFGERQPARCSFGEAQLGRGVRRHVGEDQASAFQAQDDEGT